MELMIFILVTTKIVSITISINHNIAGTSYNYISRLPNKLSTNIGKKMEEKNFTT